MESISVGLPTRPASRERPVVVSPVRSLNLILWFLAIVPAALIVRLISEYGVNVPFGDEWSLVPLFAKWNDHQLTFADLFRQHNEHRILFPKLIYIAFAQLTHWNLRAEMLFSVFLCAITSACIYGLLRQTVGGSSRRRLAIWVICNLLIFSPSQAENWMWGFQLAMFIPTVCLVAILLILHVPKINAIRLAGAIALAFIAAFSFGSGLLIWPVVGLYLFLRGTDKRWIWAWIAAFILTAGLYFVRYESLAPPGGVPAGPVDYVIYFLWFNGNALGQLPIHYRLIVTGFIGAGAIVIYFGTVAAFLRARGPALRTAVPWMALATYALGSALLTTYSRVHESTQQALDSRYSTVSVNLYLGLLALLVIGSDFVRRSNLRFSLSKMILALPTVFMATLVTWYLATFLGALARTDNLYELRLHGLATLSFSKIIPPSRTMRHELRINPESTEFMDYIAVVDRLELLSPPLRHFGILRDGAGQPDRVTEEFGRFDKAVRKSSTTFEFGGWAFLPARNEPAPSVVLAYESSGKWCGFALAEVKEERPDVVGKLGEQYKLSGWHVAIDVAAVPKDAHEISAWAIDALSADVFRLPGVVHLPPPE